MKPIEINCLILDDNQIELEKLGIDVDTSECKSGPITFYRIDHIFPQKQNRTALFSGGIDYVVDIPYHELKKSNRRTFNK